MSESAVHGSGRLVTTARSGRLRVLHMVLNVHEGGLERILGELIRRLDPGRFDVHVLALEFLGRLAEGLDRYAHLHVCDTLPRWSMLHPAPLIRQVQAIAPDVVHTHSGVWYKASLAARRAGVRTLVHTDHGRPGSDTWQHRMTDRLASRRTDRVIAVSEALATQLVQQVGVAPALVTVIPNGIDTRAMRPAGQPGSVRQELGISPGAPVLGSVGRLDRIKGFDVMLDAFAILRREWSRGAPPVLIIAGDGPEMDTLAKRRASLRLENCVHLLGWRDDVHDLFAAFDIFTMASLSEGTSISLLEAMSAAVCPVVTDVGGNAAVLGSALAHRLCPADDAAALATAWQDAIQDPPRRCADAVLARTRASDAFSLDAMVRAYETLYESLAGRTGYGPP